MKHIFSNAKRQARITLLLTCGTFAIFIGWAALAEVGEVTRATGTLTATDLAGNISVQTEAIMTANIANEGVAGQSVINLGAGMGQLINGVQVEGKWYYYWDRNGDGLANSADTVNHDTLDGIFNRSISGEVNPNGASADTNHTYRYATLNGVHLALPTLGQLDYTEGTAFSAGLHNGTAVSSPLEINPTYDDLLAIWDAYNRSGTGMYIGGVPPGWADSGYWSATSTGSGRHASLFLYVGYAYSNFNTGSFYVVLQLV